MINWLKRLFSAKVKPVTNCLSPKYIGKTEPATIELEDGKILNFKVGGKQFYRMKREVEMPYGRYKFVAAFLYEVELRMTSKTLKEYLSKLKDIITGTKGTVDLSNAYKVIWAMESRLELNFEPETARNLASVVFFDDTEDMEDFDQEYGKKKLELWDKHKFSAFFLTKPMDELLGVRGISEDILKTYTKEAQEITEYWNSVLLKQ